MFKWEDREYVNARKKIFKNLDTGEILNLEVQDDPDNIETESETPLTAHNLNLAQQELVDDMSKVYAGTNITAETVEGIGKINKAYGKCTQKTSTEGSNWLDTSVISNNTSNGITLTKQSDGTILLNGTTTTSISFVGVLKRHIKNINSTHSVVIGKNSGNIISGSIYTYLVNSDNTKQTGTPAINSSTARATTGIASDVEYTKVVVGINSGTVLNNVKIFIEVVPIGTTSYIPFTPNMPSVEYPAPIECVGDDVNLHDPIANPLKKGLWYSSEGNIANNSSGWYVVIPIKGGKTYTISKKHVDATFNRAILATTTTSTEPANGVAVTDTWIQHTSASTQTIKTSLSANYLFIGLAAAPTLTEEEKVKAIEELKVCEGTVVTSWSPYGYGTVENISKNGSNTSSNIVYVDKPLCGIGNVRDELDYSTRKIMRRYMYEVFDGSDDESWAISGNNQDFYEINTKYVHVGNKSLGECSMTNILNETTIGISLQNNTIGYCATMMGQGTLFRVRPPDEALENLTTYREWLSQNNIILIYELVTPIVEDIDCSNKIAQYADSTTVYNRDEAEIEVLLTNNKAISEINQNLKRIEEAIASLKAGE